MEFFTAGVGVLKTLVTAIGAGLGAWGVINLMEGYGNDNPGAKSQGIKQLMAGGRNCTNRYQINSTTCKCFKLGESLCLVSLTS